MTDAELRAIIRNVNTLEEIYAEHDRDGQALRWALKARELAVIVQKMRKP